MLLLGAKLILLRCLIAHELLVGTMRSAHVLVSCSNSLSLFKADELLLRLCLCLACLTTLGQPFLHYQSAFLAPFEAIVGTAVHVIGILGRCNQRVVLIACMSKCALGVCFSSGYHVAAKHLLGLV
jgi:hypothetical protein